MIRLLETSFYEHQLETDDFFHEFFHHHSNGIQIKFIYKNTFKEYLFLRLVFSQKIQLSYSTL
jgi:hypothetical protein